MHELNWITAPATARYSLSCVRNCCNMPSLMNVAIPENDVHAATLRANEKKENIHKLRFCCAKKAFCMSTLTINIGPNMEEASGGVGLSNAVNTIITVRAAQAKN